MKLAVCYLAHQRPRFFELFVSIINKIKESNKKKLEIHILGSYGWQANNDVFNKLKDSNIKFTIHGFSNGMNYTQKIDKIPTIDADYYMKLDDDTFFNNHVWDYMIENIHYLDNKKNVCMAPLFNNGIPTVERFIQCFLTNDEINYVRDLFSNFKLGVHWNIDYSSLNIDGWNQNAFFNKVSKFNHHYKGIHPVRVLKQAHNYILNCLFNRMSDFNKKNNYELISCDYPYMCNSAMIIRSDIWKNIINDKTLWVDPFDEVPLNKFKDKYNLNFLLINNSMGINTGYNTIKDFKEFEVIVFNNLLKAVNDEV